MTIQRYPSLAHWGAFTALVEDGRVVGCEPFAHDPAPSAMLDAIPAMVHSPLRVRRPAIREGWRDGKPRSGHDTYRGVSWDQALDTVAGELSRVREKHGASGIFGGSYGWSSAGRVHHARTLTRRFLALGGGFVDQVGNYSWGCAQFLLPHVIGTFEPVTGRLTDWNSVAKHTRLMIAFGGLASVRNGQITSGGAGAHALEPWLRRSAAAGVEFVVVSPLKSDAPEFLRAQWIQIRPNTDTAMMLAMAHTLISEGRHDADFVARYCAGFDGFERYVMGADDGTPKTPEWAQAITGVAAETIVSLARRAAATRSMITCSFSLQRAEHGEQPYWASIVLAALIGQIGLPGGGFGFGHGSMNGTGTPRAEAPGPELLSAPNPAKLSIPVARIADMLLDPGAEFEFNGKRATYPDIRLIYWAGGNPFHHHQDLNRLRRAWQKPETVVVHEAWWTPTARHADIVLPATTMLERNDVGGSSRDPFVLAMHRAIAPQGKAKNDFEIFRALAARLGYEQAFTEGRNEAQWCQFVYERVRSGAAQQGVDLPSFQQFWAEGFIELPPPTKDYVLFEDFRRDPGRHPLKTPSGKIELASPTIAGFGYDDCPPQPSWIAPAEWLGSPQAARFPIHLITHQPPGRLHSQMDYGPVSQSFKVGGREPVRLNPDDARARGIGDGDIVRLFNDRGACLAGAVLDPGVMPGVAAIATGAWFDPSPDIQNLELHGNPNVLTRDAGTSRLAQGPSALTALCEIERWRQQAAPVGVHRPPAMRAPVKAGAA